MGSFAFTHKTCRVCTWERRAEAEALFAEKQNILAVIRWMETQGFRPNQKGIYTHFRKHYAPEPPAGKAAPVVDAGTPSLAVVTR